MTFMGAWCLATTEGLTVASLGTSKVPMQSEHSVPSEIHDNYALRSHNAVDHPLLTLKTQTHILKHLKQTPMSNRARDKQQQSLGNQTALKVGESCSAQALWMVNGG